MKMNYLLIGIIVLFGACTQSNFDEQISDMNPLQDESTSAIIHFNSTSDFFKEYNVLLGKTQEEQKVWAISKSSDALLSDTESCNDSIMQLMPKAFQALFNKRLEVEINDSTIQYKNGELYLTKLNNGILKKPILCGSGESTIVEKKEDVQTRQSGEVSFGNTGLSHQHEFSRGGGGYKFKYVHEFRSAYATINNIQSVVIGLIIKFEYKKSRGWKQAGEQRDITLENMNCIANVKVNPLRPSNGSPDVVHFGIPNRIMKNVTGDIEFPIARATCNNKLTTAVWSVNSTGKISHKVSGEPGTLWVDYQ